MTVALEAVIGRQLTEAEQAIDVVRLDRALAKAKDLLNAAIHEEMLRATLVWITNGTPPRMSVTQPMRAVLDELHRVGAEEAWLELDRLGYDLQGRRHYIEPGPDGPTDVPDYLSRGMRGIEIRIEDDLVAADLSGAASAAVTRAVMQLPGARDLASRAISTALIGGFASTWEQVKDDVFGWEWTAVLDAATCERCEAGHGTSYSTWEEATRDLPGGGPNPSCFGGGRCRCRLVPLPPLHPDRIPGAENAKIEKRKLTSYLLDAEHPHGGPKARFFTALGYTAANWEDLRQALLAALPKAAAGPVRDGKKGPIYEVVLTIQGPLGSADLVTAWEIREGEAPRLVTAYPSE